MIKLTKILTAFAFFACAAGSLTLVSSCATISEILGRIFEPTESVYATVEHASAPKYNKATYSEDGKLSRDAYYTQNFNIKTDDGRRLRGSHKYDAYNSSQQLYTGARGQAKIGLKTGELKDFEVSY